MALLERIFDDRGRQTFLIKGQIVNIFRVVHQRESGVDSSQMNECAVCLPNSFTHASN